jgi:NAD(P)-dependent dehydrogenase (short-subunit alcohol dehydrogenase family)
MAVEQADRRRRPYCSRCRRHRSGGPRDRPAPQALGRLRGKVCLVTGAAAGIGRATAELFAREGALLALFDVNAAALERLADELTASGAEVTTVAGDVSQDADVRQAVDAAVGRFGRLDVLVATPASSPSPTRWRRRPRSGTR